MTREEWINENGFGYVRSCDFCAFYHDGGEELIDTDEYYCEKYRKKKKTEIEQSFCRVMRDDGVKDYYFSRPEFSSVIEGCDKWIRN